ncbi:L,D-transpeptidase family protein [Pseudomonas sp. dw_358]|uniref:L,D-transpeptidase family protein n=1 Tax=Pseudomonas sp. dw_358 TaxID=2720083 RepID=UPI002116D3DD|nr:L,D-transpeptidase family protein [Pseudomonas sp. dw_358]
MRTVAMRTSAVIPILGAAILVLAMGIEPGYAETSPDAPPTVPQPVDNGAPTDPVAQAIQKILVPPASLSTDPVPVPVALHGRADINRALLDFYLQRGFASAWSDSADVDQLMTGLARTPAEGLSPEDFRVAELTRLRAQDQLPTVTPEQQAQFDLAASRTYLEALLALRRGKVDPIRLDMAWNGDTSTLDPREDVQGMLAALLDHHVAQAFEQAPPHDALYTNLREGLARLRAVQEHGGWAPIGTANEMSVGSAEPAVKALRARLIAGGYLDPRKGASTTFDTPLAVAVRKFQKEQYLPATGRVTSATLVALNVPVTDRIDQIRVNMERARWLLYKHDGTFVVVDIAGYKVALYRDGKAVWHSRVQVGKPVRNTPMFQSQITYVTFNPTWTVPPTILTQDVLPKIQKNPGYLAANHIRVLDRQGMTVDPATVDWKTAHGLTLRQDAGPENSLGQVVIRFPNPYAIYLHDTPHRELFNREMRATSSGCIRVEHPLQLVELLFNDPEHWDAAAIQAQLATGKTTNIHLPVKVPVLLAYWTVDPGEQGRVAFKPDVYGQDQVLLRALNRPMASPLAGL